MAIAVTACSDDKSKSRQRYYVELEVSNMRYGFSGRFSELRALHQRLQNTAVRHAVAKHDIAKDQVPKFPSRYWLRNMRSPENRALREKELFRYYGALFRCEATRQWLIPQCDQVVKNNIR